MNDAQELARKVLLYLGKSPEDAVMTFAEDGSTHKELLDLAAQVRDAQQLTIEKELQIETNPTGKHRCLNCGQLKPESDLYRGEADWACVDPEHCGPFRDPIREDYEELTNSFAQILFITANPDFFTSGQYESDKHDALMQEHFLGNKRAYQLLRKLVSIAIESRSRWGMSPQDRTAEEVRRRLEMERVLEDIVLPRGAGQPFKGIPYYIERWPAPYGFHCPFCHNLTDRNGIVCSSCGKALRPLEPPKCQPPPQR